MTEKSAKRIKLMIEGGPTREFSGGRTFVIGRSQNADFSIPHPNLSREHVRISLKDDEVWMEDLGSANGTYVQGQKIPPKSVVKIKPHYRVLLGTGSNVVISFSVVEDHGTLADIASPKGDVDLPAMPVSSTNVTQDGTRLRVGPTAPAPAREATRTSITRSKMELDFPKEHFPHEAKKEKAAELRIIEAKKQRVLEDIQYKEREIDDLRSKIRDLRDESNKLKENLDSFRKEVQPLADRKAELEASVQELDVIYEEKIDTLETGFQDLKQTLEESHAVRMARADKDFKDKVRKQDEYYANQLNQLDNETQAVREEGERIRDSLTKEKKHYEESLKKVRADAEALEADRRLTQVRIDTEIAQLQGTKMKLENELETLKRERDKVTTETNSTLELGRNERATLEETRRNVELARIEQENIRRTIDEIKGSESKNIQRVEELKAEISRLEVKSDAITTVLRKAEEDAEAIREAGRQEVEKLRLNAQELIEAERQAVRRNVESEAQARILAVESQVVGRVQAVDAQVAGKLHAAEAESARLVEQAMNNAAAVNEKAAADAAVLTEKASVDARAILDRFQADGNAYFEAKKHAGDALLAGANDQLEAKRRTHETELNDMRKRTELEMRQVRSNALADIEAAKEREMKEFTARMKSRTKEIGNQLDRIVGAKLSGQFGVTMDPVSMKTFSDEIHSIVASVIAPTKGNTSVDNTIKSVMPVNSQAQERAVLYWKKVGIAAAVIFVLLVGKVTMPGFYSMVGTKIAGFIDVKDNTDQVVKRMLRERQLAMTFVTEQDQHFRENYTDNLLYTEGFIEMKEDVESQKVWTLGLNKFFQGDLGLTEKAIVQFGSAEGRMIRELIDQRKNILPQQSADGVAKMREIEATFVKEMKFIVRTDANWQSFQTFHHDFYHKYTQSFINRAPAANSETH